MDLGLTEEQKILKDGARKFLSREWNSALVRETIKSETGHNSELWEKMAALGWMGLFIPEAYGGAGLGFFDLALLVEACGRALVPTTFYSTLNAGLAVLHGGSESQKKDVLSGISQGGILATLAIAEPQAIHDPSFFLTSAVFEKGAYTLSGTKLFVSNAQVSEPLIVAARTAPGAADQGISLFLVERGAPGVELTPLLTFGEDKQCEVRFDSVRVSPDLVLGDPGKGWPVVVKTLEQATVLQCAEMVGGAQTVLDMTVQYMIDRHQFDRPLGSFQVVQHMCADMSIFLDGARELTYQAASLIHEGFPSKRESSMAKAWVGDTYKRLTLTAHQLFGGIGFSREHDLYLYSSRAKATELGLGTRDRHLDIVAQQLGL